MVFQWETSTTVRDLQTSTVVGLKLTRFPHIVLDTLPTKSEDHNMVLQPHLPGDRKTFHFVGDGTFRISGVSSLPDISCIILLV